METSCCLDNRKVQLLSVSLLSKFPTLTFSRPTFCTNHCCKIFIFLLRKYYLQLHTSSLKDKAGIMLYFCCLSVLSDFFTLSVALSPEPIGSYRRCKSLKIYAFVRFTAYKYIVSLFKWFPETAGHCSLLQTGVNSEVVGDYFQLWSNTQFMS